MKHVNSSPDSRVLPSALIEAAAKFRATLNAAREAAGPVHFSWYPYDSLGNIIHITRLLEGTGLDLSSLVQGKTILDLGCADGDFAFFLESLGASVVAVDHPRGNYNTLAGISALRDQLHSDVQIRTMDLEKGVHTGPDRFELTLALGLLYHLRNPFGFLESLSTCTRYCILSTRVMRRVPGVDRDVSALPLTWLLGSDELNADDSNFWIFTEAALRRLFERAHWQVRALTSVGDTAESMPHTMENDERAFCLLESCYGDIGIELGAGWHEPEDTGWRWTAKEFTVRAQQADDSVMVTASIYVPDVLIASFPSVTLNLRVNGEPVDPEVYSTPGKFTYTRRLPVRAADLLLEFSVSHAMPPDAADKRERSLIVESVHLVRA
jgi:hypothetical protein